MPETGATMFIPWLMTKYLGEYTLKKLEHYSAESLSSDSIKAPSKRNCARL